MDNYITCILCLSTNEFANLILSRPGIIHSFRKENTWYDIVCARILEPQTILICKSDLFDCRSLMFALPSYQISEWGDGIPEKQSEECLKEMIQGLEKFMVINNYTDDTWYVTKDDLVRVNIEYKRIR